MKFSRAKKQEKENWGLTAVTILLKVLQVA